MFSYFARRTSSFKHVSQCCGGNPYLVRYLTFYRVKDIYSCKDFGGSEAEIKGWVRAMRKMKDYIFLDVDDGSWPSRLQVVVPKTLVPDGLTYGSSVEVVGKLVPHKQTVELAVENISVVGSCDVMEGFPFAPRKTYPPEYVRQYTHLRPRTRSFSALLRVRHCATLALHKCFTDAGFFRIDVPVLTSNDCEGAGEVFCVRPESERLVAEMMMPGAAPDEAFFNGKSYLTVSGQFHLEVAARALSKVYCLGPTFRAENSKSRLHLSEFYMAEAEVAFTKSLDDILSLIETLVRSMCQTLLDSCGEDLSVFTKDVDGGLNIEHLLQSRFAVDSYESVCEVLNKHGQTIKKGEPLSKQHELFLVKHNNNTPVFVVDWPADIKPFYMKAHQDQPSKVHAVDLLCANVGELCGGSLREDDLQTLESKLKHHQLDDKLSWYLDLRKFGNVPSGGFGMGFERFLQVILGIQNIRDVIPFPRYPHNCKL